MFQLASPLSKVVALILSAGLTWSTLGTVTESFQHDAAGMQQVAQLPRVTVVGQREVATTPSATAIGVQEVPDGAKLTQTQNANKSAAI